MHRFSQLVFCTWTLHYYDAVFKTTHLILFSPLTYLCPRTCKPPPSNIQLPCCERILHRQPQVGLALQSNAKPLSLSEFYLLLWLLLCQNQTITHKRLKNDVSISSQIDNQQYQISSLILAMAEVCTPGTPTKTPAQAFVQSPGAHCLVSMANVRTSYLGLALSDYSWFCVVPTMKYFGSFF